MRPISNKIGLEDNAHIFYTKANYVTRRVPLLSREADTVHNSLNSRNSETH